MYQELETKITELKNCMVVIIEGINKGRRNLENIHLRERKIDSPVQEETNTLLQENAKEIKGIRDGINKIIQKMHKNMKEIKKKRIVE